MLSRISLILCAVALAACQATPQTQELLNQNQNLQEELIEANEQIAALEAENRLKQEDIDELNRVLEVLDEEKTSRVQESSQLRSQVRDFVQQQIDALKEFLVRGDLLDYIGGELVERSQSEDKSRLLVDLAHPIPRNGTLTGVGAYFTQTVPFQVKILRPMDEELVVIWESQLIDIEEPGRKHFEFPVTVGLEKGDYLGYYFPEAVGVPFDEGTGDTRYLNKDLQPGGTISQSSLLGESKSRAYSIGGYGLLN